MDNIIKFEKTEIAVDEVGEKAWGQVCGAIDTDLGKAGFGSYADEFKSEFKPIFEGLFAGPLEFPLISPDDNDPIHKEWRSALERTQEKLSQHKRKLVLDTYIREINRFIELRLP